MGYEAFDKRWFGRGRMGESCRKETSEEVGLWRKVFWVGDAMYRNVWMMGEWGSSFMLERVCEEGWRMRGEKVGESICMAFVGWGRDMLRYVCGSVLWIGMVEWDV
jgi:hypothetical protein